MRLAFSALVRAMLGFALFAVLLFLPAGTWAYFGGWLFILCLFVPMLLLGTVLALFSPTMLQKRLDMAQQLLIYSQLSVGEIAEKCGFQSIYYFSKYFKKRCGVSPGKFAQLQKR